MHLINWFKSRFWLLITFLILLSTLLMFSVLLSDNHWFYAFWLTTTITLIGCTIDFWKYYRHLYHTQLRLSPPYIPLNSWGTSASEQVLWQTISHLNQEIHTLSIQAQKQSYEQLDYYTLWAHQIKTPIAASQLLINQMPHSPQKQSLEQELFKIQRYVDLVLHFLRMETFHQDLNLRRESLDELVRDVIKQYAILFINKKISLTFEPSHHTFVTDRKWFALLIEQLIANAIKYTPSQGNIHVSFKQQKLIIKDTGIGIQESDIPRVFERGFTGFNGRFQQHSSGLGLYIAKTLSDKFDYQLALHSQVDIGTTVSLTLNDPILAQD